jgi:hypothetical protein
MRMSFPIFLGVLVVLAGLSILLDAVFKIHIPFVRSAFALLLIFLGVRMLFGAWAPRSHELAPTGAVVMSDGVFAPVKAEPSMKYDIVFGHGAVDLTRLDLPATPATIDVNVIFSGATVTVNPAWPIVIEGSSAFGEVRMPDQTMAAFGAARYRTREGDPILRVRVNAVFGSCQVLTTHAPVERPRPISAVTP